MTAPTQPDPRVQRIADAMWPDVISYRRVRRRCAAHHLREEGEVKYFDNFADHADVVKEFEIAADAVSDAEILYAQYGNGSYDGCARVLFERDGKVFRVDGAHCSCYGLEGQWSPEETSWQAEAMRPREFDSYDMSQEAHDAFWALVDARLAVLS